ncbi:hypothetical protein AJ79_09383 [Helicocarpus griseus UAMH5409]|uniref:Histone deacetylase domain-containing protein n=1 Tax=Helicocarpus griseus UAMH5409 TaxID=1447875 RepID=A0A2B7WK48_9EURO|nr:hypothetical protein AJ79_09383 [Helicocarpus griseus UAMH5409]
MEKAQREQQPGFAGRFQRRASNKHPDELTNSFNRLSIATNSATTARSPASPSISPFQSPSRSFDRNNPLSRHDTPSRALADHPPVPRKTPSSSSLRDQRRGSTPGLQKKSSTSSLRSVQNSPHASLSRRPSSNFLSATSPSMHSKNALTGPDSPVLPPLPTASSIAQEHFKKELALHQSTDLQSKTLVIVQDACYGHRFSRPRTSKAGLEQIVERPERLLASVLGVSTAYVRMGRRHEGSPFAPHPDLNLQTLPVPPFQIRKTTRTMRLNSPAVTHVHGTKWMDELQVMCEAAPSRLALNGKELVRPSSSGKDSRPGSPPKLHEGDLYLCAESQNAFEGALGAVCEGVDSVFGPSSTSRAFVSIRPPGHHCSADYPSGFCWINNVHVGIAHAAMSHGLTHAAIIDFDLHHGDGSQDIAWEQNRKAKGASKNAPPHRKTSVGYFSLHDINSYPCEGGDMNKVRNASVCLDNAHGQCIWNVHLDPWKTPSEFWELYNTKYSVILEKARGFLRAQTERLLNSQSSLPPKAAIFISAGFDASEWEGIGMQRHKVNVPTDFYAKFSADIVRMAEEEGLGVDGRVISVLEGGYSDRALTSGVLSHLSGLSDGQTSNPGSGENSVANEMQSRLGLNDLPEAVPEEDPTFDPEWWKLSSLEELERACNTPPMSAPRKVRDKPLPTYCSPTQSSVAKIAAPIRERRSLSSQISTDGAVYLPPPPPIIDWATAAYEMSKVLIPTDRTTVSFQHAELKAEGARTKRDRHSTSEVYELPAAEDQKPMQLREREPKAPTPELQTPRRSSRASRRTTIASISDLPDTSTVPASENSDEMSRHTVSQASRRPSVASTVASTADGASRDSVDGSSRPSSNAGSRRVPTSRPGTSNGNPAEILAVKKSRATSAAKPPTQSVRSSPRKAAAVSHARSVSGAPVPPARSSSINTDTADRELTGLSAGIKRLNIKLKVPSPEEHAAREEERRKAMADKISSRKSQTAKTSKSSSARSSGKTSRPGTASGQASPHPSSTTCDPVKQEALPPVPALNVDLDIDPLTTPDLTSPPLSATSTGAGVSRWLPGTIYQGAHEEPEKRPSPEIKQEEGPSTPHISPPLTPKSLENSGAKPQVTAKPPQQNQQNKLPVFTSTSAIPFAPSPAPASAPAPRQENRSEQ